METIKRRKDFLQASSRGRKFITHTFILQMIARPGVSPEAPPRFGFTVTRKMGNAVIRNRIKRRLREAVRQASGAALPGHDYVLISRHKALDCPFAELLRDMEFAFSRIIHHKSHSSPSITSKPS